MKEEIVWVTFNNTTVKAGEMGSTFGSCVSLKTLDFNGIKIPTITSLVGAFKGTGLITLNIEKLDLSGVTQAVNTFEGTLSLTNVIFGKNLATSISFGQCKKLTHDSLMSIINNLATVTTTQTLTLGAINIAKLSSDEIAIAVNKGWTVV